jgi:disulfide bond formation protein DsbB
MQKKISDLPLIFLLLSSIIALTSAYIAQFGFDYQPCILCLYQRKPFFAVIALAAIALAFFKTEKTKKFAFFFCVFFLLINVGIATYHVGVEKKIFQGPTTCSSENLDNLNDLEDLRIALMRTKAIRCDVPSFVFLSLSMAAWNVLYCAGTAFVALFLFNRKRLDSNYR